MSFVINKALFPYPTISSGTSISGQALTATSTVAVSFTTFNALTGAVMFDIQTQDVYCTIDGQTPASGTGHILYARTNYTWSAAMAKAAKFIATTTAANSTIFASELQF